MKIIVGFSYPKKFKIGAFLISFWIKKPYSHCYIKFEDNKVFHAAHGQVHFIDYVDFNSENNVLIEYELFTDRIDEILTDAQNLVKNTPYGYLEIVEILYKDIHYNLGFGTPDTLDSSGYICSELVGKILIKYFNCSTDKPKHLLKPNEIEDIITWQLLKEPKHLNP